MPKRNFIRKHFWITERQKAALEELADRARLNEAQIIRMALDEYFEGLLRKGEGALEEPAAAIVKLIRSSSFGAE